MIIIQTPLRISLFGGGTDFETFYQQHGGCVLSTAIDKYIFVTIKKRFDDKLRVGYTRTEMVDRVDEIEHELIREALKTTGISSGVEITTMGDIPSAGSGLGSSSTVTVGALHAMHTYQGQIVPADVLAKQACHIEIDVLKKPIGVQDQYIVAQGGLRFLEFKKDGTVESAKLSVSEDTLRNLNDNLMLFYTGFPRSSASILTEQKTKIVDNSMILQEIKGIAQEARREIENGDLDEIGKMLHRSWQLKKKLAKKISNGQIDDLYQSARKAGALGGKISGAGGGGFLLLYCPYKYHAAVRESLKELKELPFRFENDGSKVIFNYRR